MQSMGRQFASYTGVGAVATAVHYLVLVCTVEALHWPAWQGALVGALAGVSIAYVGNRRLTFRCHGAQRSALWRFALVALAGAATQSALVAIGTRMLLLHYLIAQALATGLALLITFLVNRRWTFR